MFTAGIPPINYLKSYKKHKMEQIFNMKLHEKLTMKSTDGSSLYAIRVPGGWIYQIGTISAVFVPYNSEFFEQQDEIK